MLEEEIARLKEVPNKPPDGWLWFRNETKSGYEYRSPDAVTLAKTSGIPLEELCLAVAAASEFPVHYPAYVLAGMHCIINAARSSKISIHQRVTQFGLRRLRLFKFPAEGSFGRQSGRYCASYNPPTRRTLTAAVLAMGGLGKELAQGATKWLSLRAMDGGVQAGQALNYDAESIVRKRYKEGLRWIGQAKEIDEYVQFMMGPSGVELPVALDAVHDGRKRWGFAA